MDNKECEYCGEEGIFFFMFTVQSPSGTHESGEACAECIATWFIETPEDVKNMMIWRGRDG